MKILWVKAGGLVPPDIGGKIRSYSLLKELARKHPVTVFTFYAAHPDDVHSQLEGQFARVVSWPLELPARRSLGEFALYMRHLFSRRPYTIAKFCRPEVARGLRRLLGEESYDVIVCDFVVAAEVIPWEQPTPKVLFTHNVEAQIWQRHYQLARNPLWKAVCWREWRTMERLERRYLARADLVLTVSENDREAFAQWVEPAKITVIPTGVDAEYFQPSTDREQPHTLVFTGSMDWLPNEEGIVFFVEEVLPRIRRQVPEVSLAVVGRFPSARLEALAQRVPGVRLTGRVDDVRPYMKEASVYIVPLRIGSGTRLKIFEAMAMGKAIVSTPLGAEGLPVAHGKNILLADEPEKFAGAVVTLLKDAKKRAELGRAARELVERKYSWASVAGVFDAAVARVARKPHR